ncbi:MAG TPA: type II secretion system F family protein [Dehalococcoidia bacterium]|nr:type II secretion system F family protein [Dehalococcoidia bacterium]
MDGLVVLASLFVAVSVALGVLAVYLMTRSEDAGLRRLRQVKEGRGHRQAPPALVLRGRLRGIPLLSPFLGPEGRTARLALELQRAGLSLSPPHYVALRLLVAAAAFLLALVIVGGSPIGLAAALAAAAVGYVLPSLYLGLLQQRRLRRIERQLPEALSIMANALRAGFGFLQAMEAAARRLSPPLGPELGRALQDANLGASVEDALRSLVQRCHSYELELVVTAVLVQREVGGNLAEILDNTARTIRERERIRGQIRTITTMQRWEGNVAALVPVVLAAILLLANRQYIGAMLEEPVGVALLVLAGVWQVIGIVIMRRIVAIDV